MTLTLPTHADVVAAAARIAGLVIRTPLLPLEIAGTTIWLKCESLQTGGAFKLRGASNRLALLSADERARGVVAFSSGNHAQGVAIAAKRLGMEATIVMPSDAPALKIAATRQQGAHIHFYDRSSEDRVQIATAIASERQATLVPSFDDPAIVAGQGTTGLELIDQLGRMPAQIVVPTGGGGLAAGIALACAGSQIVCAEPEGWDDMANSLLAGEIIEVGPGAPATLCDALQTTRVSPITFGILANAGARGVAVSEDQMAAAVRLAWEKLQLVVEPGGAVALAAVLAGKVHVVEDTVVIVSGGNIDPVLHARLVQAFRTKSQPAAVR
jgi:threonine dehydratase